MQTRILVGEADRDLRLFLGQTLLDWGFASDRVGTKRELLELAGANRYSMVIVDIDRDGADVVPALHELAALLATRVRIVLLGSGLEYENARARSSGVSYVALRKPFAADALKDVIDRFAVPVLDA